MGVKDYVGKAVKFKQTSTFDIKELYKNLRKYVEGRGYSIAETSYTEKPTQDGKKRTNFFWACSKKVEDYTKLVIEFTFTSETKEVTVEKDEKTKTLQDGEVEIILNTFISKDLEDDWALKEKGGVSRLLREFWDKFAKKNKYDSYEEKLQKDKDAIVYDAKTYLKMHRFD